MQYKTYLLSLLAVLAVELLNHSVHGNRFTDRIYWTDGAADSCTISTRTKRASEDYETLLIAEAKKNPSFRTVWDKVTRNTTLEQLVSIYAQLLTKSEMKLIQAYTYSVENLNPQFYSELNADYRNNGDNGKYPNVKRILRNALLKLKGKQDGLPSELYRWESCDRFSDYESNVGMSRSLNMFTSTSRLTKKFVNDTNLKVFITFKGVEFGADVILFSRYAHEQEVLLIPGCDRFVVKSVDDSDSKKLRVIMVRSARMVRSAPIKVPAKVRAKAPCNCFVIGPNIFLLFLLISVASVIANRGC